MLTGFWKLTWVEIKVFMREPMGVIGSLGLPVFVFLLVGRRFGDSQASAPDRQNTRIAVGRIAAPRARTDRKSVRVPQPQGPNARSGARRLGGEPSAKAKLKTKPSPAQR